MRAQWVVDNALRDEFRRGFHEDRLATWIYDPAENRGSVEADVSGRLEEIRAGRRAFAYPGHDEART